MRVILLCFFIMLCLLGCKHEKKGVIAYDFTKIKASFLTTKGEVFSNDIIDSVQFIKLQDTREPIGEIKKMLVEDHKVFIWDNSRKAIWAFHDNGKLIGQISKLGKADDGYSSIYNFSYTSPDKIHIIDGVTRSVKTYSTEGKFLGKELTAGNVSDYLDFQSYTYSFYYYCYSLQNTHYLVAEGPDNSKIGFFDYTRLFKFIGNGGDYLLKGNNALYLRLPYNDTIFNLDKQVLTAKFVFDFGKNSYPSKRIYDARNLSEVDKIVAEQPFEGNVSNVLISDQYIAAMFYKQKGANELNTSILIHNIKTNRTCTYHALIGDERQISPNYPAATDGKYFYSYFNSSELPEQLIQFYKIQKVDLGINSNPVIVKYKYKL
jgi:hypothetical protein